MRSCGYPPSLRDSILSAIRRTSSWPSFSAVRLDSASSAGEGRLVPTTTQVAMRSRRRLYTSFSMNLFPSEKKKLEKAWLSGSYLVSQFLPLRILIISSRRQRYSYTLGLISSKRSLVWNLPSLGSRSDTSGQSQESGRTTGSNRHDRDSIPELRSSIGGIAWEQFSDFIRDSDDGLFRDDTII